MTPKLERIKVKGDKRAISEWPCSCDLHLRLHLHLQLGGLGLELGRSVGRLQTMVDG